MKGWIGAPQEAPCGYFPGRTARMENALLSDLDPPLLGLLLERGLRHFGEDFFRPSCETCGLCLPLRIPVKGYSPSRSARRILSKGKRFSSALEVPVPTKEAWELYKLHKKRFPLDSVAEADYTGFRRAFFTPTGGHRVLTVKDEERIILMAHLDLFPRGISAVYCYYHPDYAAHSLGTLAILQEILLAQELEKEFLYLGYWIPGHPHMDYKIKFAPNQLLLRGDTWYDYRNSRGEILLDPEVPLRFLPAIPLEGYFISKREDP